MEEEECIEDVVDIDILDTSNQEYKETNDTEELAQFRAKWRAELTGNDQALESSESLSRAEELYWMGASAEERGDMSSAIHHYKQAVQLVPDIEQKITRTCNTENVTNIFKQSEENERFDIFDMNNNIDSIEQDMLNLKISPKDPLCTPVFKTRASHISVLPLELLQNILYLAVLQDLDLRTLEQFGMVCKGFYILAREGFIWKRACYRLWGEECSPVDYHNNWRLLYISYPHVHFNGVYISQSSYIRTGEKSLDNLYKPFHTVVYYRYLRFHSDGTVVYLTSPEEPNNIVGHLKHKTQKEGIMFGSFTQAHNTVSISVNTSDEASPTKHYGRNRRQKPTTRSDHCEKFEMEFEIYNSRRKLSSQLEWMKFSYQSIHRPSGHVQASNFNIDHTYTPFLFSRVKSYSLIDQQL